MATDAILPRMLLLPLVVFLAEMSVVTLGTIRVIFISRGRKLLAPILGCFEIVIWLFAIGQIMKNLTDLGCYVGFAAGFTLGNFLGVLIEKQLAIGNLVIRIITHRDASELIETLKAEQYGLTSIAAEGATGPVKIILIVIKRRELDRVVGLIERFDSRTFYSVEEVQAAQAGIFPAARSRQRWSLPGFPRLFRLTA
jgi:uncharacterized protein YebE (UPF0316 family)